MPYKYPLATSSWDNKEIEAIQEVVAAGRFTMGEKVTQFEREFANHFGSKYAVMVNSGSSANLLMVASLRYISNPSLKLNKGDTIIVPAVSWSTSYFPIYQYGLKLKFVDIDLETLNYDLTSLAKAIDQNTRAILIVNLLGNPNDFSEIERLISGKDIIILEDNCESMGARFNDTFTGTFGLMGSFSCFYSHHISTMEGGMILTENEELYQIMCSLRSHGWTRGLNDEESQAKTDSTLSFYNAFNFILPGYNVRPLEMSGAIGIEQLKKLPGIIKARRANGAIFQTAMAEHPKFIIQREIGESSWFGFSLILRQSYEGRRDEFIVKLDEIGFECRPIVAGNFTKNEVVKYLDYQIYGVLKNASYIHDNGLFVGNHNYSIEEAIEKLARF